MPLLHGNIHVYFHNIQTPTLKPLGQSKPKFYVKHLEDGVTNVYINNPGNMTKMTTMPIYGKNPLKIFFYGAGGPISTKLDMKYG